MCVSVRLTPSPVQAWSAPQPTHLRRSQHAALQLADRLRQLVGTGAEGRVQAQKGRMQHMGGLDWAFALGGAALGTRLEQALRPHLVLYDTGGHSLSHTCAQCSIRDLYTALALSPHH